MFSRFYKECLALLLVAVLSACGDLKPNPVSWDDIARTIPSDPDYVVSVNIEFATDSVLNRIWTNDDVISLIRKGLALDSVQPSHLVVISYSDVTYVTWPLPNPRRIAKVVEDWPTASLNNTVDAHILTNSSASIILSSTQAWVVDNVHGDDYVNSLLSAAMDTKAANVAPFASCIAGAPSVVEGVIPYDGKYYAVQLNHEEGQLRVDIDAYNKIARRLDLVSGFGRLPEAYVDSISTVSPFAAFQIERGNMPKVINYVASLFDNPSVKLGAKLIAPAFIDAQGTVLALWDHHDLRIRIPFVSAIAAEKAERTLAALIHRSDIHIDMRVHSDVLEIRMKSDFNFPALDKNRSTPHSYTQTENPAAVAFARVDLGYENPVEAYFELAPMHGRLQIDFKEKPRNLADALNFVKTLIFSTL